jgi:hypothetical protein
MHERVTLDLPHADFGRIVGACDISWNHLVLALIPLNFTADSWFCKDKLPSPDES